MGGGGAGKVGSAVVVGVPNGNGTPSTYVVGKCRHFQLLRGAKCFYYPLVSLSSTFIGGPKANFSRAFFNFLAPATIMTRVFGSGCWVGEAEVMASFTCIIYGGGN